MNRQILFRGKSKNNLPLGHWVYGDLHTFGYKCFIDGYEENTRVVEDTVGQYTGLCDKNGKKIFEGDIVLHDLANELYEVVWQNGKGFRLSRISQLQCNDFYLSETFCKEYAKVIGNIYDNPELLEVENDRK